MWIYLLFAGLVFAAVLVICFAAEAEAEKRVRHIREECSMEQVPDPDEDEPDPDEIEHVWMDDDHRYSGLLEEDD